MVKKNYLPSRKCGFDPWVRKIPWKWQSTAVLLPGKSHGQRSLVGCSPWGYKRVEQDSATEQQQQEQLGYADDSRAIRASPADERLSSHPGPWATLHQFSSVIQSCLTLCNPWTAARKASVPITNSRSLLTQVH